MDPTAVAVKGITDQLLDQKILGAVALGALLVAAYMFRKYEEVGKRERALYERYVATNEKTEALVRDLKSVVEAFTRRVHP